MTIPNSADYAMYHFFNTYKTYDSLSFWRKLFTKNPYYYFYNSIYTSNSYYYY